jgi:transcriptional regulator with XRE-family HTH domain
MTSKETKMSDLGSRIEAYREANDLTEQEFADKAEISQSYLNQIESGKKKPGKATLARIEKILDDYQAEKVEETSAKAEEILEIEVKEPTPKPKPAQKKKAPKPKSKVNPILAARMKQMMKR